MRLILETLRYIQYANGSHDDTLVVSGDAPLPWMTQVDNSTNRCLHYSDVIMDAMASQITSLTIVYSTVYSRRRSKKTSKLRVTGLLCGEFTGDRWIPRTIGQLRGKCFHLMTSSWCDSVVIMYCISPKFRFFHQTAVERAGAEKKLNG